MASRRLKAKLAVVIVTGRYILEILFFISAIAGPTFLSLGVAFFGILSDWSAGGKALLALALFIPPFIFGQFILMAIGALENVKQKVMLLLSVLFSIAACFVSCLVLIYRWLF